MKCPHCQKELASDIKYFSEHQAIELDERGEVIESGPVHNDAMEDIACGDCLKSLNHSRVLEINGLVEEYARASILPFKTGPITWQTRERAI